MASSAITGPILSDVRRSPSGSAAAPSWSFADATGTGVYLASTDVLALSTAGVQRVVVDAAGNVGINAASPTSRLTIGSGTFSSAAAQTTGMYTNGSNGLVVLTDAMSVNSRTGTNFLNIDASGNVITKAGLLQQNLPSFSNFNTCLTPMTAFSETAEFVSGFQPANSPDSGLNWWFCKVYSFGVGAGGLHFVVQTATSLTGAIYTRFSSNGGSTWGAWSQK